MKNFVRVVALVVTLVLAVAINARAQVTLHYWNFNTVDTLANGDWNSPIAATTGTGSLIHEFVGVKAFTGSTVNAEGSDPSGSAFCPQGGTSNVNNGKSFTLSVPTTGYQNITFSYVTRRTASGFPTQQILYSTDGGSSFTSDTTMTGILTSGFETAPRVVNFSAISGANNNPNFKVKIIVDGATGATGNNRFDNVKVQGLSNQINDGDGTAAILNSSVGTYNATTIFPRASVASVTMSITGVPAANLDKVKVTVPSTWSGYSTANVSLGGAFTGNTPVFSGNDIQINSANLGTTAGTITITSLTTPNPVGAQLNGNDIWTVQTAKSAGNLTNIATLPVSYTIIPIQNIRTGGVDGFGNTDADGTLAAMAGQVVAITGVATIEHGVLNTTAFTSFFVQDGGSGMQVFRNAPPVTTWVRGDNLTIRGAITNFNGGMEINPSAGGSPDFFNLGAGSLPSPLVLAGANQVNEANEGRLVQLNGVTYDSVGRSFVATISNNSADNYHTGVDTGAIWLHSVNSIVGKIIPATGNIVGVIYQRNDQTGPGQPGRKIAPRGMVDLGLDPAAGSGTATIFPIAQFANQTAVTETLKVKGDGVNTLNVVTIGLPSSWTWTDTSHKVLSGAGFASAHFHVTGDGSSGNPYVINIFGAVITNTDSGFVALSSLNTPASTGITTWGVKTGIDLATIQPVSSLPTVNIVTSFSAIQTGNWSDAATWAGNAVPGVSDDVSISTLHIAVTIDVSNAVCHNLTMLGSGTDTTGGGSGPVLKFIATGAPQLTVNGALSVTGGSGGGSGNRGGRAQLTSNGNASAILIVKGNVTTTSSNTITNGNAGLNMNEGTVKLIGATSDSIIIGAGHRLGNLEIGDGSSAKTMSTAITSSSATMAIRSLTVKQGSTFWLGTATTTNILTVGSTSSGIPTLSGGITVEPTAGLRVQLSTAGQVIGTINLLGGGITNNGTLDFLSFAMDRALTHCHYNVVIDSTDQTIGGSNAGSFADMTVGSGRTLTLQQRVNVASGNMMVVNGTLAETAGHTVVGTATTTRNVGASSLETFGGIGLEINSSATAPGSTIVTRTTGIASVGGSSSSILRYFDITPTTNSGLAATMRYFYDDTELAGQNAATLQLWKSEDVGSTWAAKGGTVSTSLHQIELTGVDTLSRWTASDATHPLSGSSTVNVNTAINNGWNMISNAVTNPVPDDSAKHLFPTLTPGTHVFLFNGGYLQRDTMINGIGYWGKFPGATTNTMTGTPLTRDSISVVGGWNMVGSISNPVDTATVIQVPGGLKASAWFGFGAGYLPTTPLIPGKAYWIKANFAGKFVLANPLAGQAKKQVSEASALDALNTLTVTDSKGGSQTLYFGADAKNEIQLSLFEMPPAPPAGVLDARFETSAGGSMVQTHAAKVTDAVEFPVRFQSGGYPVTVSWKINGGTASYELADGLGGRVFHAKEMKSEGSIKITNSGMSKVVVRLVGDGTLPAEYALSQNYPNPFNPTTNIKYALPVDSRVTVQIYNVLGQRVRTLVNDDVPAGYHIAEWNSVGNDGQQLGSGVYFLQLSAKGTNGKSFNETRKLMLLK